MLNICVCQKVFLTFFVISCYKRLVSQCLYIEAGKCCDSWKRYSDKRLRSRAI